MMRLQLVHVFALAGSGYSGPRKCLTILYSVNECIEGGLEKLVSGNAMQQELQQCVRELMAVGLVPTSTRYLNSLCPVLLREERSPVFVNSCVRCSGANASRDGPQLRLRTLVPNPQTP